MPNERVGEEGAKISNTAATILAASAGVITKIALDSTPIGVAAGLATFVALKGFDLYVTSKNVAAEEKLREISTNQRIREIR